MANNKNNLTINDYINENGITTDIDYSLNSNVATLLEDGPLDTNDFEYLRQQKLDENVAMNIEAAVGNIDDLNDDKETAASRYSEQVQLIHDAKAQLAGSGKDSEDILNEAEKEKKGLTHFIFDTLDYINRPMMAVEGIFQGVFARKDDLYDGQNMFERALAGFNQGLTGAEDEEGHRIINEANLASAFLYGEADNDWTGIERLMIGLPIMFAFGRYDPMMTLFSKLAKSETTFKSAFTNLKDKGVFGRLFDDEVFDLAFEDSVWKAVEGAGSLKTSESRGVWNTFKSKVGLSDVIIKDSSNPGFKEINLSTYYKDLARNKIDLVNSRDTVKSETLAAVKHIEEKIYQAVENAINNGNEAVLKDIDMFNLTKEFRGGNTKATIEDIRQQWNVGANKKDFRKAVVQSTMSKFNRNLLSNGQMTTNLQEIIKSMIDGKDGAKMVMTGNQITDIFEAFLSSGLIDSKQLVEYLEKQGDEILNKLDNASQWNLLTHDLTSGKRANIRRANHIFQREFRDIWEDIDKFKDIKITDMDKYSKTIQKDIEKLISTTEDADLKEKLVKAEDDIRTELANADHKQSKIDDFNKHLDTPDKVEKALRSKLDRFVSILKGDITFSPVEDKIAQMETLREDFMKRKKLEDKKIKKYTKHKDRIEKEIEDTRIEIAKNSNGKLVNSVNDEYKNYETLVNQKEELAVKREVAQEIPYLTEAARKVNAFFPDTGMRTKTFPWTKDKDAVMSFRYITTDQFESIISNADDPEGVIEFIKKHSNASDFRDEEFINKLFNGEATLPNDKVINKFLGNDTSINFGGMSESEWLESGYNDEFDLYGSVEHANKKTDISNANNETPKTLEKGANVSENNTKAVESFQDIVNIIDLHLAHEGEEIETIEKTIEDIDAQLLESKDKLNKLWDRYQRDTSGLPKEEQDKLNNLISKLRLSKNTIKQNDSGLLDKISRATQNSARFEKQYKKLGEDIDNLVKKTKENGDTFDRVKAKKKVMRNENGEDIFTGNYSQAAIKELMPLLDQIVAVDNLTDYVDDASDTLKGFTDSMKDKLDMYSFSFNEDTELGQQFKTSLDSIRKGHIKGFENANAKQKAQLVERVIANLPLINSRAFKNLTQVINIGTDGQQFVSPELKAITEQLGGLQDSINDKVFTTFFKNLPENAQLKNSIMNALTKQQDMFSGEIQDAITNYQKHIAIKETKKYDTGTDIRNEVGDEITRTNDLATGGASSLISQKTIGSIDDINTVSGRSTYGANYKKYDINKQTLLDNPLISANQQAQDMMALSDMLVTMYHAADQGVIFGGHSIPARLVKMGRYKEINRSQLIGSITNILKLENDGYVDKQVQRAIRGYKKAKADGRPVFEKPTDVQKRLMDASKITEANIPLYTEDFLRYSLGGILDTAIEDSKVYVPTEFYNMLKVEEKGEKSLNAFLATYDKLMNVWKTWTLLSPGFNFKNFAGNFASQYTVDREAFRISKVFKGFDDGIELNHMMNSVSDNVEKLRAEAWKQGMRDQTKIDEYIRTNIADNDRFPAFGEYKPEDIYVLMKEAKYSRVLPQNVQEAIGMQTNKGVASVAYTPNDVIEAYKAADVGQAVAETNPLLASFLSGHEFDTKKPQNLVQKLLSWNLNVSLESTNGMKLSETIRLKKLEQEWAKEFFKDEKLAGLGFGEFDEYLSNLTATQHKAWKNFERGQYRKNFGFESRNQMVQDMFFDPGAMFGAEKNVLSRVMPFWGFWKKSMQLSLSRLNKLDFQGMYGIERGIRHIMDMQQISNADMSEFSRNAQYIPIKVGDNKLLEIKWGNPTNTLNNLLVRDKNLTAELYSNANPVLKFLASEVANREDLFFGGKYDSLREEAVSTLAPGSFRNFQRYVSNEKERNEMYGDSDFSDDYKKGALARMMPSVFKEEVISDNQMDRYNAAALVLEKALNDIRHGDSPYQIAKTIEWEDLPQYQDYIWDIF